MPRACLSARPPRARLASALLCAFCLLQLAYRLYQLAPSLAFLGGRLIPQNSRPSARLLEALRKGKAGRPSPGPHTALPQIVVKSTMIVNAPPSPDLQSISDTFQKMGQSSQSKIYSFDPVLQQEILLGEQILLDKSTLLRQSFKEQITQNVQTNELLVYFSPQQTNSSEKVLEHLRKHVNVAHLSHVQSRFYKKLNSIVVDENQLNQMYVINNDNTLSLISYRLSAVQMSNEERLFLIIFAVEKIPINKESLPVTLAFLEEAAPPKDSLNQSILDNTEFVEDIRA